jgi:hypothetical protein
VAIVSLAENVVVAILKLIHVCHLVALLFVMSLVIVTLFVPKHSANQNMAQPA